MSNRTELSSILHTILGSDNVYFQPPETVKMNYPCIIYELANVNTDFANNLPYRHTKQYTVTVIDKNPDSEIPDKIAELPLCSFDRHFASDNLNHFVFRLYYKN